MSLRTSSINCCIARGMRAVRLVDQRAAIGGAVEHDLLPPWRRQRLVVAEHALPGGARMRRLDQGIGEIAKLALVFGELELRWLAGRRCRWPRRRASDACRRCGSRRGCGRNRRRCSRRGPRRSRAVREPGVTEARRSGSEGTLRHFKRPMSGAPTATATGRCTFFRSAPPPLSSVSRSIRTTGRIRMVPMPSRGAPSMPSPAAAKPHPPEIQ